MQKERLSALVDGELVGDAAGNEKLLRQLLGDSTYQRQWQRYHLIRDTLRGQLTTRLPADFATRVANALERGACSVGTHALKPATIGTCQQRWWSAVTPWMGQLGEISIAASVALVVLCGLQWYSSQPGTQSSDTPCFNTLPLGGWTAPACYGVASEGQLGEQQLTLRQKLLKVKLEDYQALHLQRQFSELPIEAPIVVQGAAE